MRQLTLSAATDRFAEQMYQINAQIDDSPIRDGDLATVLVGANDVIALYQEYPAVGQPDLVTAAEAAGADTLSERAAALVQRDILSGDLAPGARLGIELGFAAAGRDWPGLESHVSLPDRLRIDRRSSS